MTHPCEYSLPFKMRLSTDSQDLVLRKERKVAMVDKCLCGQGVKREGGHGRKLSWVLTGLYLSRSEK